MMGRSFPWPSVAFLGVFVLSACNGKDGGGDAGDGDGDGAEDAPEEIEADVTEDPEEEPATCTVDGDCSNGLFCDGEETCGENGLCRPGTPVDCTDTDPCTMDACDEETGRCTHGPLDEDGDGYVAEECGGADCDDGAGDVYPDADESACNLVDNDCDDDLSETVDDDGDGWVDEACEGELTGEAATAAGFEGLGDCNDAVDTVYPEAPEGCDGTVDNDCDGDALEIDADFDDDGYAPPDCDPPEGTADCNDGEASIHPGADEACDLVDQDCDGSILEAPGIDDDGDLVPDEACGGNDCNDESELIHGAFDPPEGCTDDPVGEEAELCDLVDQDCDGSILDAAGADDDGDTVLDISCWGTDCDDAEGTTYPGADLSCDSVDHDCNDNPDMDNDNDSHVRDACGGDDCDDGTPGIHPGAVVLCDAIDRDCNGNPDNDQDGDGVLREACGGDDCDDALASVHPGADELCDTIDQDCDDDLLDAPGADDDGDEFLDGDCGGPDCNDNSARFGPAAEPEMCTVDDYDCDLSPDPLGPSNPRVIDDGSTGAVSRVAIAWSGSEHGVAWRKFDGADGEIFFSRLDADGNPIGGSGVRVTDDTVETTNPDIAWGNGRWGIVYERNGAYVITLAANGTDPSPASGFALTGAGCTTNLAPRIASQGDYFGVTWVCNLNRIMFARFHRDGAMDPPLAFEITDLAGRSTVMEPAIAWNTSRYGVIWPMNTSTDSSYQIYLDRVDDAGGHSPDTVLSSVPSGQNAYWKEIAGGWVDAGSGPAEGFGAVWRETTDGGRLMGAVFTLGGAKTAAPFVLADHAINYTTLAWNATRFGVVWTNMGTNDLEFAQMNPDGSREGPIIPVTSSPSTNVCSDMVWQGNRFGATWIFSYTQGYFAHLVCTY